MSALNGWWRLWLVVFFLVVPYSVVAGWPGYERWVGDIPEVRCVPLTLTQTSTPSVRTVADWDAIIERGAREQRAEDQISDVAKADPIRALELRLKLTRAQVASDKTTSPVKREKYMLQTASCIRMSKFFSDVLLPIILVLLLIPTFFLVRWVLAGFKVRI